MYRGGRPDATARRANRVTAALCAVGLMGWLCVRLDTVNPKSRTPLTLPLVTAKLDGRRYLVSMLGQGNGYKSYLRQSLRLELVG